MLIENYYFLVDYVVRENIDPLWGLCFFWKDIFVLIVFFRDISIYTLVSAYLKCRI